MNNINSKKLSEEIRNLRLELGLTQKEFGNIFSCSNQAVYYWECGRSIPDRITWRKFKKYGIDIKRTLAEEDEKEQDMNITTKRSRHEATVITVWNDKGGIGKTTAVICIADALRQRKYKTLLVDCSDNKSLTYFFEDIKKPYLPNSHSDTDGRYDYNIKDLLKIYAPIELCIHESWLSDFIPNDTCTHYPLSADIGNYNHLKGEIDKIRAQYDYIIFDTNRAMTGDARFCSAIMCSDYILIPSNSYDFSFFVFKEMLGSLPWLCKYNEDIKILGTFLSMHDSKSDLDKEYALKYQEFVEEAEIPFLQTILYSSKLQYALNNLISIYSYAPNSMPAKEYLKLADEIIDRTQG